MKRILGTVLILAVAAVCTRLGVWQLQRLSARKASNEIIASRGQLPPVTLPAASAELTPYRLANARGRFDLGRQIVRVGRPSGGVPGVFVVTPLVMAESVAVLVERGWAPSADARSVELDSLAEPGTVEVSGVLMDGSPWSVPETAEWPLYLPAVAPDSVQPRYPYRLLPLLLRRADAPAHQSGAVFRSIPPPAMSNGPHLNYALQWFSFGGIALIGGWILLYRKTTTDVARH